MIKFYREKSGLTVTELANRLGYSKSYLCKIEHGEVKLTDLKLGMLLKLCELLSIDKLYLDGFEININKITK